MTFSDTITAVTSFIMKAFFFYLLITAMALMETVSALDFYIPDLALIDKAGKVKAEVLYGECFNVENVANVLYLGPATCQYYTDITCKTPVSGPPVTHAEGDEAPPKNPKGFVKCLPGN